MTLRHIGVKGAMNTTLQSFQQRLLAILTMGRRKRVYRRDGVFSRLLNI